ncbi:MAG: thioredoxin family protein [Bacteroidota bacterium]
MTININTLLCAMLLVFASQPMLAQEDTEAGIVFSHDDWAALKAKAKAEKKPIFIDAYTTWCGPCKWMAANTFPDADVGDFFNANFINAKFDMEKGEGIELAKTYGVVAYPTLLFIDGEGELVHRSCGARDAEAFIEVGKKALDDNENYGALLVKYEEGDRSPEFMQTYLTAMEEACDRDDEVVKTYFASLENERLMDEGNFGLIESMVEDTDSREFKYLMANEAAFAKKFGEERVSRKIEGTLSNGLMVALYRSETPEEAYAAAKKKIKASGYRQADKIIGRADMQVHAKAGDWEAYASAAIKHYETYPTNDYMELNQIAWTFYERVENKASLKQALEWSKQSVSIEKQAMNLDTYAALLAKTGNVDKAIEVEKEVIELAKEAGEDTSGYEEMLKSFQEMK